MKNLFKKYKGINFPIISLFFINSCATASSSQNHIGRSEIVIILLIIIFLVIRYHRQINREVKEVINWWFTPKWKSWKSEKRLKWVMKANAEKSKHQKILADLGKDDVNKYVREAAVKKLINQQEVLVEIAKNDEDNDVCKAALQNLTDKSLLADVARNAKKYYTREITYKKLGLEESKEALLDMAKNSEDQYNRKTAALKLTDPKILNDIVKNSKDDDIRKALVEKINDQKVLTNVAKNDKDYEVRMAAVDKVINQMVLANIAKSDNDGRVRNAAFKKISDQVLLSEVMTSFRDQHGKTTTWMTAWEYFYNGLNNLPIANYDDIYKLTKIIKEETRFSKYNFTEKKFYSLEATMLNFAEFEDFEIFVDYLGITKKTISFLCSAYTVSNHAWKTIDWLNYWIFKANEKEFFCLSATAIEYLD